MTTVIKVENLGKKYIISHEKNRRYSYKTFQESLMGAGRSLWNSLRHPLTTDPETSETEEFWALKDINFEIKPSDRVDTTSRYSSGHLIF